MLKRERSDVGLCLLTKVYGWTISFLEPGVYQISPGKGIDPGVAMSFGNKVLLSTGLIMDCSPEEIRAIMVHEREHIRLHHWVKSALVCWLPKFVRRRVNHAQEFVADAAAKRKGYASGLVSYLRRNPYPATLEHPSSADRVRHLEAP